MNVITYVGVVSVSNTHMLDTRHAFNEKCLGIEYRCLQPHVVSVSIKHYILQDKTTTNLTQNYTMSKISLYSEHTSTSKIECTTL